MRHLVKGLLAQNIACCVVSISRSRTGSTQFVCHDDEGVSVWQLSVPFVSESPQQVHDLQQPMLIAIAELLQRLKPDVVHAHGAKVATAKVCHELGIPCIVTAHHGGLVCPNGTLLHWQGQICTQPVSRQNCLRCVLHSTQGGNFWAPVVQRLSEPVAHSVMNTLHRLRNIPYVSPALSAPAAIMRKQEEIAVLKTCPVRLVAPSNAMAAALRNNGVSAERVRVIPHGIPLTPRKPLAEGLGHRPVRLLFVGRIHHIKGLHVLLQALQGLPPEQVELHIVGGAVEQPEKRYQADLRNSFKGANVHWHGKCSRDQVEHWLAHCDISVHPTICLEVFGLTIAEALAMGRPVLASRCGGAEMQIEHGQNGWLVPANDVASLQQQLAALIAAPAQIGAMAKQVGSVNSLQQHVVDLISLYHDVSPPSGPLESLR